MQQPQNIKILELNFERTWRGGERQTIYNIQGFQQSGHEVALICRKNYPLGKAALDKGFNVVSFANILQVIWYLALKGKKYDVLHAQTSHILTYCLLTKPLHGRKVVFSRRVDFVPKGFFTKLKYRYTDKIVAVSHAVKDIVAAFSGRNDVEVISDIVVPVPLDAAKARNGLKAKGIQLKKFCAGTTAALVPHKDPLTMVDAVRKLSEIRDDFIFLHFGAGELENEVQQKIQEYGLERVYKLMGFVDDVENYFTLFDVFGMSSEEEGLGSSVLDAFIYKVPVVGTDAGGLGELLDGGRGIKCSVKAPDDIAKGIHSILSDKELFRDMVQNAYDYVVSKHHMGYITAQYIKVFS